MATKEEIDADVVGYVKTRLVYAHKLKQKRLAKYWKYRNEYAQDNIDSVTEDGYTNYHLNTGLAVVQSKTAEIFANTPKYDFVGIDKDGREYKRLMEKGWEWIWKKSNTNKAIGEIILDAMKYGSGFGREYFHYNTRMVSHPEITKGEDGLAKIIYSTPQLWKSGYEGCRLQPLQWHNVYIIGKDMDGATEAILIDHIDFDEAMERFEKFYGIDRTKLTRGKQFYVGEGSNELVSDTSRQNDMGDNDNTITIVEYWNKYKDEYAIILGGVHINPKEGGGLAPMDEPHKEIPILLYIDHPVDSDAYGRGELEITEKSRFLKNTCRSMAIEIAKLQGGIITIDPASDFDETIQKIGMKQFAHIAKNDLGFFQPSISTAPLEMLEKKNDEDIIVETGVDFRGQLFGPNETAEKTKGRVEAQRKRINQNIRNNAYTFYERLARLRLENIKTYYSGKGISIPVEGADINEDGVATNLGKGEWGIMKLSDKILKGDIMLLPVIDSIYGDTSKQQLESWMRFFQIAINLKKKDGTPLFDVATLMNSGKGIIDDVVDLEELLGENSVVSAEIDKRLEELGIGNNESMNPQMEGPSPYQQSGAPVILPSQAKE